MKIEFYSNIVKDENDKFHDFAFNVLPTLCVTECAIYFCWLFWGINWEYNKHK